MKNRSLFSVLAIGLVAALVATLLVSATTVTARAAGKASQDYPEMPRRCATPKQKIPAKPVVCGLNRYDADRPTVVLWGDSHSWMFIPALKKAVEGRGVNLVAVMMGSCPPMDNRVRPTDAAPACFRSNALGIEVARKLEANGQPYRIVLAGSWQRYLRAIRTRDRATYVGQMAHAMRQGTPRLARTLRTIGAQVDVVGQVATVPAKRRRCAKGNDPYACQLPRAKSLPEFAATKRWTTQMLGPVLRGRPLIDVNAYFCTSKVCKGKVGTTRTWFDDLHLSATMSRLLAFNFASTVNAVKPPRTTPGEPGEPGGCTIPILNIPC